MKFLYTTVLLIATVSSGCTSLKESTGKYISEAVSDKVRSDLDDVLQRRGLSLVEISKVADLNGDSNLDSKEIFDTVKGLTKDYLALEAREMLDTKLAAIKTTRENLDGSISSKIQNLWLWLIGAVGSLVSTYLGKQVYSAKKDGKRDQRIALMEKMLQKDLDNDGLIGGQEV